MFSSILLVKKIKMFTLFSAVDSALSRFSPSQLTSQTSMELLVEGFSSESQAFFKDGDEYKSNLLDWPGLTLNADGDVTNIEWNEWSTVSSAHLSGKFDTRYLPAFLENLCLSGTRFTGSFDFSALPKGLKYINLSSCAFTGSMDLTALPEDLTDFLVIGNSWGACSGFSGTIDLCHLPQKLTQLIIRRTQVEGKISLQNLPNTLVKIQLDQNYLEGSLSLANLPSSLVSLDISRNDFFGEIDLGKVPTGLLMMDIHGNDFWGTIDLNAIKQDLNVEYMNYQGNSDSNAGLKVIRKS